MKYKTEIRKDPLLWFRYFWTVSQDFTVLGGGHTVTRRGAERAALREIQNQHEATYGEVELREVQNDR